MAINDGFTYTTSSATSATITDYSPTISSQAYDVTIPTTLDGYTVVAVGDNAFSNKSLSSLIIEHNFVTNDNCFSNNSNLSVTLDSNLDTSGSSLFVAPFENCSIGASLTITSNVTTIPNHLFALSGLTALSIPSSVTNLVEDCFRLNSISSIYFTNTINLDDDCFTDNPGIQVTLDTNVTVSAAYTVAPFSDCEIAANILITSNVTNIPAAMFASAGITTLSIPSSVTNIGSNSFRLNTTLSNVYVYNPATVFGSDVFTGNMSTTTPGTIHGHAGSTAETLAGAISNYVFQEFAELGIFNVGQYVRIKLNDEIRFTGIINSCSYYKERESRQLFQNIDCVNLNNIPARRTIKLAYTTNTTASTIVTDMVDDFLSQEGIEIGEIDDGIVFEDEWINDLCNIAEVLDECANRSGYQWFIDNDMKLNFYKNPNTVSLCTYTLDGSSFTDFRGLTVEETIDNYTNKLFVVGGNDDHGDLIYTINGDITKQNEMQNLTGGTGVYGIINRDSAIVGHDYYIIESGSSPTRVNYVTHSMTVGDFFWNVTRDVYSFVTAVHSTYFECESVASQASGDTVEVYGEANQVGRNMISRQGQIPQIISFRSYATEFYPGTKLSVSVSDMSLSGVYSIDEVNIDDVGAGYFETNVKACRRIEDDFNTQKNLDYTDYFRGL